MISDLWRNRLAVVMETSVFLKPLENGRKLWAICCQSYVILSCF